PTPTRTGYTFGGWYKNSSLTGTAVKSIATTALGDQSFYAKWTANTYTVTYDGNGSTGGSTADSVHTYSTAKNLTANGYEKKYTVTFDHNYTGTSNKTETVAYTFDGWNTKADGSGTSYTNKSSVKNLTATNGETVTLYAKWSPASPTSISYAPTRTNYTFAGWYTDKDCSGSRVDSDGTYTPAASVTLYAKWAGDDHGVTLHANGGAGTGLTTYSHGTETILPTDWTKPGYTFKGWYDNVQCGGEAVTAIPADAVGDKEYWAKWTDDIPPMIGNLEYNYTPKTLWQWLIGKESLRITVPVTEKGSGADVINYTVTPDGGSPEHKTAPISGGKAVITVDVDFKGTIFVVCTDRAGNTSASVTVGAGKGVMIEDHAPRIELKAVGAELLRTGEYETLPDISVTVADDKDNAISSGIASLSYKIGEGSEKLVGNASDYTADAVVNKSFTVGADELSAPETVITVTAADHAGNSSTVSKTIKVHTHSGTLVPAKAAACAEDGNLVHYGCACGKMFTDSACKAEITDRASVILAKLGHVYAGDYQYDAEGHWKVCSRCKTADTRQSHNYDNDKDDQCNDCGYKRTIKKSDTDKADEEKPTSAPVPETEQPTAPDAANPSEQPTAPDLAHSTKQPTMPTPSDTRRQPQAAEVQDSRPEDKQELESAGKSEPAGKTSETQTGQFSESGRGQTVPASIDNGKITISGGLVATGNVEGMTGTSTVLEAGKGAVIVKVVCAEQECTAGVADTIAVANAVLTQEHLAHVNNGGQVEIRIDVKDISNKVPAQDRETIERGIEEYQKDMPGLTHGMYLDISMFMKVGDGDWNPITETEETVEIVIGIPEHMQGKDRTYVIIRTHDGEHTLLNDLDDAPDTITIHTERFSSYAIAYVEGEEAGTGGIPKCRLCHICPTFLGICCFIWLAVIAAVILIVILVQCGKERRQTSGH
ncbi:MAG: InlB B-repeat-containing protein, partial [Lachnospiraceae bacterium]|nr:InlB B-repeat-containing protein [Lachnospiraceae bacterium]